MKKIFYDIKDVIIATTLAPRDIDNQRKAISSWIAAGFKVISLNCYEEIQILEPYFLNVEFVEVKRDARDKFEKPYVYFDDFMKFFKQTKNSICGIINSDIHLLDLPPNFKEFIIKEAKNSFVFGSRMDVESLKNKNGIMFDSGFDYFFFDQVLSNIYPEAEFCIGQPAWDYWIVVIPILNKIKVKKIIDPIAYHIRHPINWNLKSITLFIKMMKQKIGNDILNKFNTCKNIDINSIWFLNFINKHCDEITIDQSITNLSVLVVYENSNLDTKDSLTYESIMNQKYDNFKIIHAKKEYLDFSKVKEELIVFIREGCILSRNFISIMSKSIEDNDYVVCGIRVKNDENSFMQNIYPFDLSCMSLKMNVLIEECIMYKSYFLKKHGHRINNLNEYQMSFIGQALVQSNLSQYFIKRFDFFENGNLFIYCAGGHTRKLLRDIDFSKYNLCGIIDSNKNLAGSTIEGYPVYHSDQIRELKIDYILISSISFEREIYQDLAKKIDENKILKIYYN